MMRPERAIVELTRLKDEAIDNPEVQFDGPVHDRWRASVDALMANSLPSSSNTFHEFRTLSYHVGVWTGAPGEEAEDRRYFASQVRRATALIEAAIFELGFLVGDTDVMTKIDEPIRIDEDIFVVHGHNEGAKYQLVRLLDKTTNLNAVVLHEQPNRGLTILEKFEQHATKAAFAVALLTADDLGGSSPEALHPRGRQNVVFELGVFVGLLGRDKVVVLYEDGVELPSDLAGLIYLPLDSAGAWRLELLKEIEAAGFDVYRARIP